jgi:hypothetical protein
MTLARAMFFVFASFGLLLGGGIILVAATAGVCAAAAVILYGAAHLFADLLGFSFRWGLVTSCGPSISWVRCGRHDPRLPTEAHTSATGRTAGDQRGHSTR